MRIGSKIRISRIIFSSFMISFFTFLLFLPFGFLDFDGGHDAYMTIGALAIREGVTPFTGVNLQYGIVTPYLQSLVVHFTQYPTLNLRILDSVVLSATAGISFYAIQSNAKSHRLSIEGNLLALFVWLGTAYFLFGIPQLPWSSTFILFTSILIALINFRIVNFEKQDRVVRWFALLGFTAGLAPFIRINAGLALICFEVVFVLLISRRLFLKWSTILTFLASLTISFLIIPLYLVKQGTFPEFVEQCILIPRKYLSTAAIWGPEGWNTLITTRNYFLNSLPLVVLFLIIKFVIKKYLWRFPISGKHYGPISVVVTLLITVMTLIISNMQPLEQYSRVIVILYVSILISSFAQISIFLVKELAGSQENGYKDWQMFILSGISVSLLTQTFPTNDPRHIWWSILPGLFVLTSYMIDDLSLGRFKKAISLTTAVIILATLAIPLQSNLSQQRTQIDFPTISAGMRVSEAEYKLMKIDFQFLKRNLKVDHLAYFDCGKGETHWYAAFDRHYHSRDLWFINLSFYPGHPIPSWISNLHNDEIVVVCGDRKTQQIRQDELQLKLIESGDRLGIFSVRKLSK